MDCMLAPLLPACTGSGWQSLQEGGPSLELSDVPVAGLSTWATVSTQHSQWSPAAQGVLEPKAPAVADWARDPSVNTPGFWTTGATYLLFQPEAGAFFPYPPSSALFPSRLHPHSTSGSCQFTSTQVLGL